MVRALRSRAPWVLVVTLAALGTAILAMPSGRTAMAQQMVQHRAWALVTIDDPNRVTEAFNHLKDLATRREWDTRWQIKRIDVVLPMPDFPSTARYSIVLGVKGQNREEVRNGLKAIRALLQEKKLSKVEAFEGDPTRIFGINWP